ncbi:MFS transporter [Cupriavidus basilensis]
MTFGALTMAISGATDWRQILFLRFLSGLGLGGVWSAAAALVNETWPAHQRGRATAFVLSSFSAGATVAALAAAYLLPAHGWRVLFFLCGAAVVIAIGYVWLRVPESEVWLAQRFSGQSPRASAGRVSLAALFAPGLLRITLLGTATSALALSAYWGASTWLPTFLVKERGLDVTTMASFVAVLNCRHVPWVQRLRPARRPYRETACRDRIAGRLRIDATCLCFRHRPYDPARPRPGIRLLHGLRRPRGLLLRRTVPDAHPRNRRRILLQRRPWHLRICSRWRWAGRGPGSALRPVSRCAAACSCLSATVVALLPREITEQDTGAHARKVPGAEPSLDAR